MMSPKEDEEDEMFSFSGRLSNKIYAVRFLFGLGVKGLKATENSVDNNRLPDFLVTEVMLTCLIIPDPNAIL